MNNLTLLEIIFILLFVTLLGYVIYNMVGIIAMKNTDADEESKDEEDD